MKAINMTNVEYYGFKNLLYESKFMYSDKMYEIAEIYYIPKHNKNKILLKRLISDSHDKLVQLKTKWLLADPMEELYD